jgi:hypothetical protein
MKTVGAMRQASFFPTSKSAAYPRWDHTFEQTIYLYQADDSLGGNKLKPPKLFPQQGKIFPFLWARQDYGIVAFPAAVLPSENVAVSVNTLPTKYIAF